MTTTSRPLVYIASPYTKGDVAANVSVQMSAAHRLLDLGYIPYAPVLSHYLHIHKQRPYEDWLQLDLEIIPRCDGLLRLPGDSPGADREVALMQSLHKPVFFGWVEFLGRGNQLKRPVVTNTPSTSVPQ